MCIYARKVGSASVQRCCMLPKHAWKQSHKHNTTCRHVAPGWATLPDNPPYHACSPTPYLSFSRPLAAANQFAPARWYIPGQGKPRPQQPFVGRSQHASMKLVVFVKYGQKPIVAVLHGGPTGGLAAAVAGGSNGDEPEWNGPRYVEVVDKYLLQHPANRRLAGQLGGVKLVHDRDSAHTCNLFRNWAKSKAIEVLDLPAKGADLDPLDYAVFGSVKKAWKRQVWAQRSSWDQQCVLLLAMLQEFDPSAAITALPSRIQRCIATGGWHFEG